MISYLSGSVKRVEHVLHGESENLRGNTEHGVSGLDSDEALGLADGLDDGLDVEGLDGTEVDDLTLDTVLLLEVLGGDEGLSDTAGEGDDGNVGSSTLNLGLSDGNDEVVGLGLLGHGEALSVEELVLEDNDRVGVANSGLQQSLGILGAPGRDHLKTGDRTVPCGVILGVLGGDTGSKSVGSTESDVAGLDTSGHVVGLCSRVNDLVNSLHL
jgi:hypothetical protein